jgi:hypothetical protein
MLSRLGDGDRRVPESRVLQTSIAHTLPLTARREVFTRANPMISSVLTSSSSNVLVPRLPIFCTLRLSTYDLPHRLPLHQLVRIDVMHLMKLNKRLKTLKPFNKKTTKPSHNELYGFFHPITREWTDGLASSIRRQCITGKSEAF